MADLIDQLNAIEAKNKKAEEEKAGIKVSEVNINRLALTQLEKDRALAEADFSKWDTDVNGDELISLKSLKKRKHSKNKHER